MGEVRGFAVGGVEVGADARVEAVDGGLGVGAGEGDVDRVVGGRGVHLEPEGVEQQLPEGVVVHVEPEVDLVVQADHGLRFGF